MRAQDIRFMGATITPVISRDDHGFVSMVIVTTSDGEKHGSGAVGCFESEDEAYRFAVEYARSTLVRQGLLTLPG
jgi:hypothetical protein